jgi:serine/threonine-protein kinase RsbT
VRWRGIDSGNRSGIELDFEDHGPGISDVNLALQEGYTTGDGLGMGLSGARRLMNELEIQSVVGQGTKITMRKWHKNLQ